MKVIVLPTEGRKPRNKTQGIRAGNLVSLTKWRLKMNGKSYVPDVSGKRKESTTRKNPYRILLAEDDNEMRAMLVFALHKAGYEVIECSDGLGLLTHLEPFLFNTEFEFKDVALIISDIRMPGFTGLEVLEGMQNSEGFPPMILITAFGDRKTHAIAEKYGAAAVFDKPFDLDDLLAKVHELLAQT